MLNRVSAVTALLSLAGAACGQQSYDFASAAPEQECFAFADEGRDQPPVTPDEPASRVPIGLYAAVAARDGAFFSTTSKTNARYALQRYQFHVAEDEAFTGEMTVEWTGRAVNENPGKKDGASVFAWRVRGEGAGSWRLLAAGPKSEEVVTLSGAASNGGDFVSADGVVTLLVASSDFGAGQPFDLHLETDFISLSFGEGGGGGPALLGHWTLDDGGGSRAADSSGQERHGALQAMEESICWTAGRLGGALTFDGFNDRVEVPHDSNMTLDAGTVALWVLPSSVDGTRGLVTKDSGGFDGGGQFGLIMQGEHVRARLESADDVYQLQSAVTMRPDQWRHVAFTFGPSGMALYVDGVLQDSNPYPGGGGNAQPLIFGADTSAAADGTSHGWTAPFAGALDDVRLYSYALAADEIAALYDEGAPPRIVRWQEVAPE